MPPLPKWRNGADHVHVPIALLLSRAFTARTPIFVAYADADISNLSLDNLTFTRGAVGEWVKQPLLVY